MTKKNKTNCCDCNSLQIDRLLTYLQYILPTKCALPADECVAITAQHFKSLYGDWILNILQYMNTVPITTGFIKKQDLEKVINQIREYIVVYLDDCFIWEKDAVFKIANVRSEKKSSKVMSDKQPERNINDKCMIGLNFMSLLILFDDLLSQVRMIDKNECFKLNVARLFSIVDSTNQANKFYLGLRTRQSRVKGANETAEGKRIKKEIVSLIVQHLGIKSIDARSAQAREMVRKEYKRLVRKNLKISPETLTNYIIDAAGHAIFS